jgi:hypothetical protein
MFLIIVIILSASLYLRGKGSGFMIIASPLAYPKAIVYVFFGEYFYISINCLNEFWGHG